MAQRNYIASLRHPDETIVSNRVRHYLVTKGLIFPEKQKENNFFSQRIWYRPPSNPNRYGISIRAYFISKVFEILTGQVFRNLPENHLIDKIIAVGEYCITIMYLENHFIDGKYGVTTLDAMIKNRLEKVQMQDEMNTFIEKEFDLSTKAIVHAAVDSLFQMYEAGNSLDKNSLGLMSYQNCKRNQFHSKLDIDLNEILNILQNNPKKKYAAVENVAYLELYLTRSYLINGVFFTVFTDLLIKLFSRDQEVDRSLELFSQHYGIVQQLVNDNIDFVPASLHEGTSGKLKEDAFSDLGRGMVTLPILYHLESHYFDGSDSTVLESLHVEAYQKNSFDESTQMKILDEFKQTRALNQAMSSVAGIVKNFTAQTAYLFLGKNRTSKNLLLLGDLMRVGLGNKGYQILLSILSKWEQRPQEASRRELPVSCAGFQD